MTHSQVFSRGAVLGVALSVTACGGAGGLSQSRVQEPRENGSEALNAPIAVGASLVPEVHIETPRCSLPVLHLASARPDVITIENGALLGKAPGVSAILFATDEGRVVDFLHVWVAQPSRMTLARLAPTGSD